MKTIKDGIDQLDTVDVVSFLAGAVWMQILLNELLDAHADDPNVLVNEYVRLCNESAVMVMQCTST